MVGRVVEHHDYRTPGIGPADGLQHLADAGRRRVFETLDDGPTVKGVETAHFDDVQGVVDHARGSGLRPEAHRTCVDLLVRFVQETDDGMSALLPAQRCQRPTDVFFKVDSASSGAR